MFSLATISTATDNFSVNNKLGEGGFGPVYRVRYSYMIVEENIGQKETCKLTKMDFTILMTLTKMDFRVRWKMDERLLSRGYH